MSLPRLATVLVLVLVVTASLASGCYDESDACTDYCEMAADCYDCGGNISLVQCRDECVALSIDQQKALANCAKDCANMSACYQMVGFMPPSPCVY